jgi:hypothetical protein
MAPAAKRAKPKKSRRGASGGQRPVRAGGPGLQEEALADVARALEELERPAAIIGGIAVIAWGYPRLTSDIDCAVLGTPDEAPEYLRVFKRHGVVPREKDSVEFAARSFVLLLKHARTGVEIDTSFAQLAFEETALRAAVTRSFGAARIPVPRVEDLLVYKLIASRPKDLQDAEQLLALHRVDARTVERILVAFDELLETDRVGTWRELVRATR